MRLTAELVNPAAQFFRLCALPHAASTGGRVRRAATAPPCIQRRGKSTQFKVNASESRFEVRLVVAFSGSGSPLTCQQWSLA
jgi:hypothetical protein